MVTVLALTAASSAVMVPLVLINLLLAAMQSRYETVMKKSSQMIWLLRAQLMQEMEKELSDRDRESANDQYWEELDHRRYLVADHVDYWWKHRVVGNTAQASCNAEDELVVQLRTPMEDELEKTRKQIHKLRSELGTVL
eukprot:SAG31_NODE_640_length_13322_cov_4.396703_10_plen_139_part_00